MGNWRYSGLLVWRSPELELNDIGFLRQADEIKQYGFLSHQTLKPFGYFRKIYTEFMQVSTYDFDGNFNRLQYALSSNVNLKNNWYLNAEMVYKPITYSNTVLQGGPRFRYSEEVFKSAFINTDSRKKINFNSGIIHSQGSSDSFSYLEYVFGVEYKPINSFAISLRPSYSINKSKTQYVTETSFNSDPRYITADLNQKTFSATLRLDYTINPNLTIQYYGQPFISNGVYKQFNRVTNPTAKYYGDRIAIFNSTQIGYDAPSDSYAVDEDANGITDYSIGNPNFSQVSFNSNLVVRWEYIPGSEIFLVWSQGIFGQGNAEDDLFQGINKQIFGSKPENIFLIKATYRFIL